jgi:benzoylsuccinyl-CoA thiolase BbsB subunit
MREVRVIGTGIRPFGRFPGISLSEYAYPAVRDAILESGIDKKQINVAYCGSAASGTMAGQKVLRYTGLTGIPIINVENACSSSSTAFYEAYNAIAAGVYDVALIFGMDMLSKLPRGPLALDPEDWEACHGITMPALYAMRAQRYMHEYGATEDDFSQVTVKARRHGARNPNAHLRSEVTLEDVQNSRETASPLRQLHCCPVNDGAAAVILASSEVANKCSSDSIRVAASVLHSGVYGTGYRDMTRPDVSVHGATEAYEMAGIGPGDLDVLEIHDAFASAELIYYEALGLCDRGEAPRLLRDGVTTFGGASVVNPSGGLLARGHPVGATGAAQIVEIVRQLQGRSRETQVEGARVGLSHATGGGVAGIDHGACAISIFAN